LRPAIAGEKLCVALGPRDSPKHGVESFGNVQLDKKGQSAVAVEAAGNIPDVHEIVVDATRLDEGTFAAEDDVIHPRVKTKGHSFGGDFWDHVD
jgi:hypothetical protein